jgi:hypothetical protein
MKSNKKSKKWIWLSIIIILAIIITYNFMGKEEQSYITFKAGLGDSIKLFEKTWGGGYKKIGGNPKEISGQNIIIGKSEKQRIGYARGDFYSFGNPEKIGWIEGDGRLLLGKEGLNNKPTPEELFPVLKQFLPTDFKIKEVYLEKYPFGQNTFKEIYICYSDKLAKLDGISKLAELYQSHYSPGHFTIYVNYIDDKIGTFTIVACGGNESYNPLFKLEKINKNPF